MTHINTSHDFDQASPQVVASLLRRVRPTYMHLFYWRHQSYIFANRGWLGQSVHIGSIVAGEEWVNTADSRVENFSMSNNIKIGFQ